MSSGSSSSSSSLPASISIPLSPQLSSSLSRDGDDSSLALTALLESSERLFTQDQCETTMLREYFTLIGLFSSFQAGRDELQASGVFQQLHDLGASPGHDYLRRLILANLDYSHPSSPARNLLQMWITQGSKEFRLYATCMLRALLRADVPDFAEWGIEVLVTQLYMEPEVAQVALSVLEEAAKQLHYLRAIIASRPQLVQLARTLPAAGNLLIRFLACQEGLAYLAHPSLDWVKPTLHSWRAEQHIDYVGQVEDKLRRGLLRNINKPNPWALASANHANRGRGASTAGVSSHSHPSVHGGRACGPPTLTPIPIRVPANDCSGGHVFAREHNTKAGGGSDSQPPPAHWTLEWLFRLPLRVLVQIGTMPTSTGKWTKNRELTLSLKVDSYVDASRLRPENHHEDGSESGAIRVKAVLVNEHGKPCPLEVTAIDTMRAALCLGAVPLVRHEGCGEVGAVR
jgi:hypothetical protein